MEADNMNNKTILNDNQLENVSGGTSGEPAVYIIQEGDTLSSIAERYGTTSRNLLVMNAEVIKAAAEKHGIVFESLEMYENCIYPGTIITVLF